MKPRSSYKPSPKDSCQTPPYAVQVLVPYLPVPSVIWEPAAGEGYIVDTLKRNGFRVISGDIKQGQDYFLYEPVEYDIQVTNPPWNQYEKYPWIRRAYQLGKPFALLMQTDTLGVQEAIVEFARYGIEVIQPMGRIFYKMPVKGWDSNAQMPSAWFTYGLKIGQSLTFADMKKYVPTDIPPLPEAAKMFTGQMPLLREF